MKESRHRLTWEDIKAWERFKRSRGSRRAFFWIWIMMCLIVIALFCQSGFGIPNAEQLMPFVILAVALLLIRMADKRAVKKTGLFNHEIVVRLEERGVRDLSNSGDTVVYWEYITQIADFKSHYFFITKGKTVIIVPKAAFADETTAKQFYAESLELWKKWKQ